MGGGRPSRSVVFNLARRIVVGAVGDCKRALTCDDASLLLVRSLQVASIKVAVGYRSCGLACAYVDRVSCSRARLVQRARMTCARTERRVRAITLSHLVDGVERLFGVVVQRALLGFAVGCVCCWDVIALAIRCNCTL